MKVTLRDGIAHHENHLTSTRYSHILYGKNHNLIQTEHVLGKTKQNNNKEHAVVFLFLQVVIHDIVLPMRWKWLSIALELQLSYRLLVKKEPTIILREAPKRVLNLTKILSRALHRKLENFAERN